VSQHTYTDRVPSDQVYSNMEVSQKEQNRSKWRSSTKRGRGRGRGGAGGPGPSGHRTGPDLESNYDRCAVL
jgi:hypothetical protein